MARGRSPAYDDQREMILARAAELFAHRGYPATSMNEVAQACGFSTNAPARCAYVHVRFSSFHSAR